MIEIENLSYHYAGSPDPSLVDIDLSVPRGCCFALLGPNGAGKTTLIALMTGALRTQQGDIHIGGLSIINERLAVQRLGSLVPQELAFYPTLSGRSNLEFFAGLHRLRGKDAQRTIAEAIDLCGLSAAINRRAETYSGGMKRRLNLAIGLLSKPEILYLDEPTVGIDADSRKSILDAIQYLKSTGITIVYTSHYFEEVEAIGDELAVIDQGKLVARESMQELLRRAAKKSLHIAFDQPVSDPGMTALAALSGQWLDDYRLVLALDGEIDLSSIFAKFRDLGLAVDKAEYGVGRLEDVYFGLLGRNA